MLAFFFSSFAATQLARQVKQERTQLVCSSKEAQKRLTESNGTPAMDLGHMHVVLMADSDRQDTRQKETYGSQKRPTKLIQPRQPR